MMLFLISEHGSRPLATVPDTTSMIPKMFHFTVEPSIPIAMVTIIIVIITATTGIPCRDFTTVPRSKTGSTIQCTGEVSVDRTTERCLADEDSDTTACPSQGFTFLEDQENF